MDTTPAPAKRYYWEDLPVGRDAHRVDAEEQGESGDEGDHGRDHDPGNPPALSSLALPFP